MNKIISEEEFAKKFKFMDDTKERMDRLRKEREEQFHNMNLIQENNYSELVNKIDLLLANQEVIIKLLSKEDIPSCKFISRTIDVFKQQVDSSLFVKVGTLTDNILTLNEPVKEIFITKPSTYFVDWFVKNTNSTVACEWLNVYPSNNIDEILLRKDVHINFVTIGYLTEKGTVIYYDQYL